MFDPEHLEWFFESVDDWNARRKCDDFCPRLSGADLESEFFKRRESSDVEPVFRNINLFNADLGDANMSHLDLQDANLALANLEDTRLWFANLAGANLTNSKPWLASLFPPRDLGTIQDEPLRETAIDSLDDAICEVGDLLRIVRKLKNECYTDDKIELYFRGESCTEWDLEPSVMRDENYRKNEAEMLTELATRQPDAFDGLHTYFARLVIAQHYRMPTRLLDISENPLVALYNACIAHRHEDVPCKNDGRLHIFGTPKSIVKSFNSDAISVISNFTRLSRPEQDLLLGRKTQQVNSRIYRRTLRRLNHFIREEKSYFADRIDPIDLFRVYVVRPQQSFVRIRAQSGAFLMSAFHERFERWKLRKIDNMPTYDHFIVEIPYRKRKELICELKQLNVTEEVLMPGLESAANAIKQRYASVHTES